MTNHTHQTHNVQTATSVITYVEEFHCKPPASYCEHCGRNTV